MTIRQKWDPITQSTFLLQNPILSMFSKFRPCAVQNRERCWLFLFSSFFLPIRIACLLQKKMIQAMRKYINVKEKSHFRYHWKLSFSPKVMTVTRKEVHFSSVNMLEGNGFLLQKGPVMVNGAARWLRWLVKQSAYNALILCINLAGPQSFRCLVKLYAGFPWWCFWMRLAQKSVDLSE